MVKFKCAIWSKMQKISSWTRLEEIVYRMQFDKEHTINSFEEIGMCNPFKTKKSLEEAKLITRGYDLYYEVYPKFLTSAVKDAFGSGTKV